VLPPSRTPLLSSLTAPREQLTRELQDDSAARATGSVLDELRGDLTPIAPSIDAKIARELAATRSNLEGA